MTPSNKFRMPDIITDDPIFDIAFCHTQQHNHILATASITGEVCVYGWDVKKGERGYDDDDEDEEEKSEHITTSDETKEEIDENNPFAFLMPKAVTTEGYRPDYTHIHKQLYNHTYHTQACRSVTWSNDMLYSVGSDCSIVGIDMQVEKLACHLTDTHLSPINIIHTYDTHLLVTGDDDGYLHVWDTRQDAKQRAYLLMKSQEENKKKLKKGIITETTTSISTPTSKSQTGFTLHPITSYAESGDYISDMTSRIDEHKLLVTSGDGFLTVYDMRKGRVYASSDEDEREEELLSVCLVKNGKKVVVGTRTGDLKVFSWDFFGLHDDRITGHPTSIDTMIQIDDDTIATGSNDGLIRLVSIRPNRLLGIIGQHYDRTLKQDFPIESLDLDIHYTHEQHATWMISCGHDNVVRFWDVRELYEKDEDEEEGEKEEEEEEEVMGVGNDDEEEEEEERKKKPSKKQKAEDGSDDSDDSDEEDDKEDDKEDEKDDDEDKDKEDGKQDDMEDDSKEPKFTFTKTASDSDEDSEDVSDSDTSQTQETSDQAPTSTPATSTSKSTSKSTSTSTSTFTSTSTSTPVTSTGRPMSAAGAAIKRKLELIAQGKLKSKPKPTKKKRMEEHAIRKQDKKQQSESDDDSDESDQEDVPVKMSAKEKRNIEKQAKKAKAKHNFFSGLS